MTIVFMTMEDVPAFFQPFPTSPAAGADNSTVVYMLLLFGFALIIFLGNFCRCENMCLAFLYLYHGVHVLTWISVRCMYSSPAS